MPADPLRDATLRALLVEDDPDDHLLTRALLEQIAGERLELVWRQTYAGARRVLREQRFDAVLLDYRLDAETGIDLLREMEWELADTAVLMFTGQQGEGLDLEAIRSGAADYLVKGEIDAARLERALRYSLERQRLLSRTREFSLRDELTGLYNRRGFACLAEQQLRAADRSGAPVGLLFIDLDGMKAVNDRYGHAEGDSVLRATAALLREAFRRCDILARAGGDEFVVLAAGTDRAGLASMERKLRERLTAYNGRREHPLPLCFSTGLSLYDPADPEPLDQLLADADEAMYRRKRAKGAARQP